MAQSKVRYAVVGLGYIAQAAVLPSFAHARRNSSLHAIVSGSVEKLNEIGDKYRIPVRATYDDYERVLITRALSIAGGNIAEAARRPAA